MSRHLSGNGRFSTTAVRKFAPRSRWTSAVALIVGLVVTLGTVPAGAATAFKKKAPLSLANVTVNTGPNTPDESFFDALQGGIFKKYGLNVTWLETTGGGMQDIETITSGASQFTVTTASNALIGVQQGAPLRGLFTTSVGSTQQITVTNAFAAAHNIAPVAKTPQQIISQFSALKGTHVTVAVSGLTGTNVVFLFALAHKYGFTIGSGCSTCDINLEIVGSVPNSVVAYDAGKADSIANVPPYTTQPNSVVIQDGQMVPVNSALSTFGVTTVSMIQQHPDTVQAFTDAITEAMTTWHKSHKALGDSIMETVLENNGNTAAAAIAATIAQDDLHVKTPYPTRAEYSRTLGIYNISSATTYTIPYSTFFVLRFLVAAEKLLKIT